MDSSAIHAPSTRHRLSTTVAEMAGLSPSLDADAIKIVRGLAMDAPLAAKSGHQGTALALAPLGHVLYSRILRHDPTQPDWVNRDRFILSNGHASILQYALLFINGYGLEIDDLRAFRQWGSATPGHPENGHTTGVEVTTGPLGQGFANAVGMAVAESHLRGRFGSQYFDHHTWVLAGDGCFMEGISHEAASLAGHLKLDHLVCIFDDNGITIDGSTGLACSDDVIGRFTAYGWNVLDAGDVGEDLDALESVLLRAREHRGSPTLVRLKTHIGYPSPDFTDRHEAHGNPFDADATRRTKEVLGIPDTPFWAPDEVVKNLRSHAALRGTELRRGYSEPQGEEFQIMIARPDVGRLRRAMESLHHEKDLATRQSITLAVAASLPLAPGLIAGSADLTGNTGVKIPGFEAYTPERPHGRQMYYGIREHAMGAIMVGIALHGVLVPMGGTFFVFADYMKPAIRLAALSRAKVIFVFSHDSVGVGEDGPTHQPIEQLASLRSIPGLRVIRPADSRETAEAWIAALSHDGPTALILSRQTVPNVTDGTAVRVGAKVVRESSTPRITLIGTGSELSLALRAAEVLESEGVGSRVVSMPSWDMFSQSPVSYQEDTQGSLPVVSVEAGSTFGWERYADVAIGIDRFGASAPGSVVMDSLGINVDRIVAVAKRLTGPT